MVGGKKKTTKKTTILTFFFWGGGEDSPNNKRSLQAEWQCKRLDSHNVLGSRVDLLDDNGLAHTHCVSVFLCYVLKKRRLPSSLTFPDVERLHVFTPEGQTWQFFPATSCKLLKSDFLGRSREPLSTQITLTELASAWLLRVLWDFRARQRGILLPDGFRTPFFSPCLLISGKAAGPRRKQGHWLMRLIQIRANKPGEQPRPFRSSDSGYALILAVTRNHCAPLWRVTHGAGINDPLFSFAKSKVSAVGIECGAWQDAVEARRRSCQQQPFNSPYTSEGTCLIEVMFLLSERRSIHLTSLVKIHAA